MKPLILVSPSTLARGTEFDDLSLNLSEQYNLAVIAAGGLPVVMSRTPNVDYLADVVARADGVILSGGEDVQPGLYAPRMDAALRARVKTTDPARDFVESLLIAEIFRQRKPLLAICRGLQILNAVLGGTLIVDLPTQRPGPLRHDQSERSSEPVHELEFVPDSRLAALFDSPRTRVNSTHHQAVDRVAPPFRCVATAPDGVVEALELKPAEAGALPWFLGVQFHPERLLDRHAGFGAIFTSFLRAAAANR